MVSPQRRGFTLVELLVVITIIGLLVAMLLPAIQGARESGRRTQCGNNLHQIGVALMDFENANGKFPPALNMPWGKAGGGDCHMEIKGAFGPNWAVRILPFIEQKNLFDQANIGTFPGLTALAALPTPRDNVEPTGVDSSWRKIVGTPIPAFKCPSDGYNGLAYVSKTSTDVPGGPMLDGTIGWARGNYGVSAGYEDYDHVAGGLKYKTSSKNVAGAAGLWSSPVMSSNYGAQVAEITDGTSQQILAAELRAGTVSYDPRGVWAIGMPGCSVVNAGRSSYNPSPNNLLGGIADDGGDELEDGSLYCTPDLAAHGMGCTTSGSLMTSAMSRSLHPGGVNTAMCDGSVHFLSNDIDELNWCRMSSKNDTQIVTWVY